MRYEAPKIDRKVEVAAPVIRVAAGSRPTRTPTWTHPSTDGRTS
jgi:hypothetical protein